MFYFKNVNLLLLISFLSINVSYYIDNDQTNMTLNVLAFGSCFNPLNPKSSKKIFQTILDNRPELWIWGGDSAYLDYRITILKKNDVSNLTRVEQLFNMTKQDENYEKILKKIPTIGTYDDHDYGENDGDKNFRLKDIVKQYFLDFLDEPIHSVRRKNGRGIYYSYTFGKTYKSVKIILLDTRYDKDKSGDENQDMLGQEQWEWLENEFQSQETFTFIITGTQFLPISRRVTESWYIKSRLKLIKLIEKSKKNGVVIFSGDVHSSQILRTPCLLEEIGYHLYEITSSGLSHFFLPMQISDYLLPNEYMFRQTMSDFNFAKVEFDWGENRNQSKIIVSIKNQLDFIISHMVINYEQLIFKMKIEDYQKSDCLDLFSQKSKSIRQYLFYYKKNQKYLFVPLIYFGILLVLLFILWLFVKIMRIVLLVISEVKNRKIPHQIFL